VLLLDEPMSALDQNKKGELYPWIEKLTRELRIPIVLAELTRLRRSLD
jgi:ABC-type molybdate transport system ATPase subunit